MTSPLHISVFFPEAMKLIRAGRTSTASCGHIIIAGDTIGYDPQSKKTRCQTCATAIREREGRVKQAALNERMKVE
jgi:hypothetical protein